MVIKNKDGSIFKLRGPNPLMKEQDNFKDFVREQGIDNDKIAAIIDSAPRGLFDVFDNHGVYIEILLDYKESVIFTYTVRNLDVMYTEPIKYNTRKESELAAVTESFKLLNDKL